MKIQINSSNRNEYLDKLLDLFIPENKQRLFAHNLINLYWSQGYFARSEHSFLEAYPWSTNRAAIRTTFQKLLHYGLLKRDTSQPYLYIINPSILISSGSLNLEIQFTIGDIAEYELMIPALSEVRTPTEVTPEPAGPQKINPRYADLIK